MIGNAIEYWEALKKVEHWLEMDLLKVHKKIQRNQQYRLAGDFIYNVVHITIFKVFVIMTLRCTYFMTSNKASWNTKLKDIIRTTFCASVNLVYKIVKKTGDRQWSIRNWVTQTETKKQKSGSNSPKSARKTIVTIHIFVIAWFLFNWFFSHY